VDRGDAIKLHENNMNLYNTTMFNQTFNPSMLSNMASAVEPSV
jgi:hypothetical protein